MATKLDLMKRLLVQEEQNSRHYSNCMIYAGAGCDCSVADTINRLKLEIAELENKKKKRQKDAKRMG